MTRRARVLLTVVALLAFAAGCGSSSKAPSTGSPGGDSPATSPATQGGGGGYGSY